MDGICTLEVQPGTVIRFNLIHGVDAYGYGGEAYTWTRGAPTY